TIQRAAAPSVDDNRAQTFADAPAPETPRPTIQRAAAPSVDDVLSQPFADAPETPRPTIQRAAAPSVDDNRAQPFADAPAPETPRPTIQHAAAPSVDDALSQPFADAPAAPETPRPTIQRAAEPSDPAPSPRRPPAGESRPSSLEGLDEVTLLQAFTEVQRSPLPPRQKPYLPPSAPTQEQITDAVTETNPSETPRPTIQRAAAPSVDASMNSPASDEPFDLEEALLRAFEPPSPPPMAPRQKPYLIPSREADDNTESSARSAPAASPVQRTPHSAPPPIQRTPSADEPHREPPTQEQARLLRAIDLPADTRIEGSWSAPAPVTIQRAIDTPSSPDTAPETEESSEQDVDPVVVEQLAQKVFRILRSRLRTDRERRDL
ncbi:MAG: hypothetical protein SNJ80_12070, partial [Anaerolinea sp.]